MRLFKLFSMMLAFALSLSAASEIAFAKSQFFKSKKYDALAEKGLEYTVYNPQGESVDGKAIYIFAGALCPQTQKIMKASDKLNALIEKGIQIRWVFPKTKQYNPDQLLYLANEPLPEAFNNFFQKTVKLPTDEQEIISALNMNIGNASDNIAGFPSISYKTGKGIKYTHSIDDVFADLEKITAVNDKSKKTLDYAQKILSVNPDEPVKVKNTSKKNMEGYTLPDTNSPLTGGQGRFTLKPGQISDDTCYDFNEEFYLCKFTFEQDEFPYFYKKPGV